MRRLFALAATVALALTVGGCGGGGKVSAAYDKCFGGDSTMKPTGIEQGDAGKSIIVSLPDDDQNADDEQGMICLFAALKTSDAIKEDISNTTAMMGRQSESEQGITYRWSYHPDNGLEMTIREG